MEIQFPEGLVIGLRERDDDWLFIRDIVMIELRAAHPRPLTLAYLKGLFAAMTWEMHEKTLGVCLRRLRRDGLAERAGNDWMATGKLMACAGPTT